MLRRDLLILRSQILRWHTDSGHTDDAITARLLDENDSFDGEDAAILALSTSYHRSLGLADSALALGDAALFETALASLEAVIASAAELGNIPIWWVATLTRHLLQDLWEQSLNMILPFGPNTGAPERWTELRRDFIALLGARRPPHIDLWPSQIAAAKRAIDQSDDLVIALPTSAGKTRIAELCILRALADQKRVVYVTPLRALSAQVERVLAKTFVPLGAMVTSLYGASGATLADTKTLATSEIVVATPEKLDFALRQDPDILNDVALIIFDEGHMIGLGSREIRYEVLIQRLLRRNDANERRIVCLSAMFNPADDLFKDFGEWLRSDAPGEFVHVQWRPTRQRFATLDWRARSNTGILSFLDEEKPYVPRFVESVAAKKPRKNAFPKNDKEFCICAANAFARDGHTVLVYSPQRSLVEPLANEFRKMSDQGFLSHIASPKPEHMALAKAIGREWLGESHAAMRALEIGVGTHHGALPRPFLNAVEELLNDRRLGVVVASPTLAQGIDLACSVLIFRSLRRYEGGEWRRIKTAEFSNVVGRAGRAYVDLDGIAVLPTFDAASRSQQPMFEELIRKSRGQRLVSGLAQLIHRVSTAIAGKVGVKQNAFLEYVLNQDDLWNDVRLAGDAHGDEDEDEVEDSLESWLSDLDLAVFSLVEPLDTPINELAKILDDVLNDSLWKRTLARVDEQERNLQRAILRSRAQWIWLNTSLEQRRSCFFAGLGRKSGLFIYEQMDDLVETLASFQAAVMADDADGVATAAVEFAKSVVKEPFFSVRRHPDNWEAALEDWVKGISFSDILSGRNARDVSRAQAFIQDGVVFKLFGRRKQRGFRRSQRIIPARPNWGTALRLL